MTSRKQAVAEARFIRGETGVDGQSTNEEVDPEVEEQEKAKEALYRGRAWLGREALCWLLWKSESTQAICLHDQIPVHVVFTGKMMLRAASGEVTEMSVKGTSAPYSAIVREALKRGLLVHSARLKIEHADQTYEVTLDAEFFDFRSGSLPELLVEEGGDDTTERLELVSRMGRLVDALIEAFIAVRTTPAWNKTIVPQLKEWFAESRKAGSRAIKQAQA